MGCALVEDDLAAVASLHSAHLQTGFLSTLGPRFLKGLYRTIHTSPQGILIVARMQDQVVGFVAGACDTSAINRRFMKDMILHGTGVFLARHIFSFKRISRMFETWRHSTRETGGGEDVPAELLSLVVAPEYRGTGVAQELYRRLDAEFGRRGVRQFKIVVGATLTRAQRFYERMGAQAAGTTEVHKGARSIVCLASVKEYPVVRAVDAAECAGTEVDNDPAKPCLTPFQAGLKRTADLLGAGMGLVLCALPLLVMGGLVRVLSPGPALFRQKRVGRGGAVFQTLKFRTMRTDAEKTGTVTVRGDRRVTGIGRFLRATKLDELPQLWNVLRGHMSFVGPRPDVPGYADRLQGRERAILNLRPGITGPATLFFRHEEELLARALDPQKYNDEVIYPIKVALNLEYARNWSFWRDTGYVLVTVCPPLNRWLRVIPRNIDVPDPAGVVPLKNQ